MNGVMRMLMRVMSKMMISCEKASFLASKALDTRLSLREKMALNMHTMVCKYCRLYSIEIEEINHAVHHVKLELENEKFRYGLSDSEKVSLNELIDQNSRV